jgi:sugar lactone lactonase YvrE
LILDILDSALEDCRMSSSKWMVWTICAVVLLVAPAGAQAFFGSSQQAIPLAAPSDGIAVGGDGNVYVVEPAASEVTVFTPAGAVVRQVALPVASNSASNATLGPDGQVWVAIGGSDANRGFVRIAADGTATVRSTATAFGCGPTGLATFDGNRLAFVAPDAGTGCGSHGLGVINNAGADLIGGPATGAAHQMAVVADQAWVPQHDEDKVDRYAIGAFGFSFTGSLAFPVGSGPDAIAAGPDGTLYVSLFDKGELDRITPAGAIDVADGLDHPFGIAAVDGGVYVASSGDGRLEFRNGEVGGYATVTLPAGAHPWQVVRLGSDLWVTDRVTAQVIHVVKDASWLIAANNAIGAAIAASQSPAPAAHEPPVEATPAASLVEPAPVPGFAQVLTLASSTRCLRGRALTLTVRKPAAGDPVTKVAVSVAGHQAKSYSGMRLRLPIKLTGLPKKGSFRVKVVVTLANGARVTRSRTYRSCAARKHR